MQAPVVILSPHFDDAVLSCWSLLVSDPKPTVVNVFGGAPDAGVPLTRWDRLTRARNPRERALERAREDSAVLQSVGCEPVNLHFTDYTYRKGDQDTGPLVVALLERLEAGWHVYSPAGIGGHPDHLVVRAAAVSLLRRGFDVTLYAELPYAMNYGWPHWLTGADPDPHLDVTLDWSEPLSLAEVAIRPEDADVVRLERTQVARKLEAIRGYRTQYSGMRKHFSDEDSLEYELRWPLARPSLTRAQALRYEFLWRAGVRRGSRVEQLTRGRALRRLRPSAGSRLGRLLRERGTRA